MEVAQILLEQAFFYSSVDDSRAVKGARRSRCMMPCIAVTSRTSGNVQRNKDSISRDNFV